MRVIESMTRVELPGGRILRVWRDETADFEKGIAWDEILERNQRDIARPMRGAAEETTELRLLLLAASSIARVNAVEVLELDRNGLLIYPDWP